MNEKYKKLLIHPENRSKQDIDTLKLALKDNPYFQQYLLDNGDAEYTQLVKMAYYEFIPKNDLVFEYNAPSLEFFVILSGKVSIHYKSKDEDNVTLSHQAQMREIATEKRLRKLDLLSPLKTKKGPERTKTLGKNIPKIRMLLNSEVKGEDVYYYEKKMRKIVTIGTGENFGGMNLGTENVNPRMAAIMTEEDSEFLILERKSYIVSDYLLCCDVNFD